MKLPFTKEERYAFACIEEFFQISDPKAFIKDLDDLLVAAHSVGIYSRETPALLLFFVENLNTIINASYLLAHGAALETCGTNNAVPPKPVPEASQSISHNCYQYCSFGLSKKQFADPSRVINKFCAYLTKKQWKSLLKELATSALGKEPFNVFQPRYNMFTVRKKLAGLIEALFLVNLRSV